MDDFLFRALIAGLLVALMSGPLGCLMVWQRMAYFGAALSHAALLGIAIGLWWQFDLTIAVFLVTAAIALVVYAYARTSSIANDTLLGIIAHTSLALGIVLLSFQPGIRNDLMVYLFGDILSVASKDLWLLCAGVIVVFATLKRYWRSLLSLIAQREIAIVEGVNERSNQLVFLLLISFVVAAAMQIVGILLIVSLLIIPAAAARTFSRSATQMAIFASILGMLSVIGGLAGSVTWDTPAGPSIVVVASILFVLCSLVFTVLYRRS